MSDSFSFCLSTLQKNLKINNPITEREIQNLLHTRHINRQENNYNKADIFRILLEVYGIEVSDEPKKVVSSFYCPICKMIHKKKYEISSV